MTAPKKPQDRLAPAIAEATREPFEFTGTDGEIYQLPAFTVSGIPTITGGVLRRHRHNETELIFLALEALATPEALAAVDALSPIEFGELLASWQRHAGADIPKS